MLAVFIAFLIILRWWRKDQELYQTNWKVKYGDLVFKDGTFNKVAKLHEDYVDVRRIEKRVVREDRAILKEMKILKSMRHVNLTTFMGACTDSQNVCALWEHCAKGSLEDVLLRSDSPMDFVRQLNIALDISKGLLYLHSSQIGVHGDLRMENIVVDCHWVAKVTAFGLAAFKRKERKKERKVDSAMTSDLPGRLLWRLFQKRQKRKCKQKDGKEDEQEEEKGEEKEENGRKADIKMKDEDYKDLFWMSPERLRSRLEGNKESWTKESDVYSLGILFKQIICKNGAYEGHQRTLTTKEILTKVAYPAIGSSLMRPHIPEEMTCHSVAMATCVQLAKACWSEAAEKRPSIRRIVKRLKRLTIIASESTLWDTMKSVKTRYCSKLAPLIGQPRTPCTWNRSVPRDMTIEPNHHSLDVTVCIWSVVNFTTFAIQYSPSEALQMLQDIDDMVDKLIGNLNVWKVDTICDSSMLLSGFPVPNPDHAPVMADVSLVLLDTFHNCLHRPQSSYNEFLDIRIGLNSGPAMVGVVGKVTPRLCVFGNTLRSALLCENQSFPRRIHISSSTREHLQTKGSYSMELRNPLDAKTVSGEPTYWLTGRSQEMQESYL